MAPEAVSLHWGLGTVQVDDVPMASKQSSQSSSLHWDLGIVQVVLTLYPSNSGPAPIHQGVGTEEVEMLSSHYGLLHPKSVSIHRGLGTVQVDVVLAL